MFAPLIALAAAAAPAAPADLRGIWQGTVGNRPVRACFARQQWGTFGAYFYLSRQRLIPLGTADGAGRTFHEGDEAHPGAPQWVIESADSTQLTARWTGGGRTLPVRLSRVAGAPGDESPCSSLIFHQTRLAEVRTVRTRAAADGVAFTRLTLDHGGRFDASYSSFALDGSSEAVRRINAALGETLAGDPPAWFDCIRGPLDQSSSEGSFNGGIEPALISRRWLSVVQQEDTFCGGAHPNAGQAYRAFDLASGNEIDLHDWFNGTALSRERAAGSEEAITTIRPGFRNFILARWHGDGECDEVVRSEEYWAIGLTRAGFVFSPQLAHVVQACEDDFLISFARLRPYLTAQGAEKVRALQAEPPGRRPRR